MRFGSLFAGIGGIDLGLERAGMECAWQVEIDGYCQKVLEKHWPDVTRYGDIREVDFERVGRVDLVCGGFPCQPVSYAGSRRGEEDERWLWPDFAKALRALRPRYVLVENVPGLLGRGMGDVLSTLADLGYDAQWEVLPASAFGAPHYRERLFVVAYPRGERFVWGAQQVRPAFGDEGGQGVGPRGDHANGCPRRGSSVSEGYTDQPLESGSGVWAPEPHVARMVHGVPRRVDRVKGLANAVVPQIAEWIGRSILSSCESVHSAAP